MSLANTLNYFWGPHFWVIGAHKPVGTQSPQNTLIGKTPSALPLPFLSTKYNNTSEGPQCPPSLCVLSMVLMSGLMPQE